MKDMNWPERVAYLENQLADSDRENQRLSEFIKGLPDGDETPAQLAEAQRFRRSTMYWHERAMKAEVRLAEAEQLLEAAGAKIERRNCIISQTKTRLAEAERNEGTLLGMIHHQRDVLRECLPYINESMAGRRPGRCADDIRAAVKALTADRGDERNG